MDAAPKDIEERFWEGSDPNDEPTLGERMEVVKRERVERAFGAPGRAFHTTRPPENVARRSKKSRPREISSKRPVPVGRERCLGIGDEGRKESSVKRAFDPRFEEQCGELREEHVERNYAFVEELREKRRKHLQESLRKNADDEEAVKELRKLEEEDNRRKVILRRRKILQEVRQKERESVKRGKKPFFLKNKELRKLEMEAKYKELKQSGSVKKYIEKRRRRLASKDRKLLPKRREE